MTLFATLVLLVTTASAQPACVPVDHAGDDLYELNRFWGTAFPLCRIWGQKNAFADRARNTVFADQDWLDTVAVQYGSWAATGVLAHEWGHMIQPINLADPQRARELQANCLAGVFFRGRGLPREHLVQFANHLYLVAGENVWTPFGTHGTKPQRLAAVTRGYEGYTGQVGADLLALCPASAF